MSDNALIRRMPRKGNEWERFVPLWLHGRPESTQGMYLPVIKEFREFVSPKMVGEVALQDLQEFQDKETDAHHKSATIHRKLATVKSLLTWSHRCGLLRFEVGKAPRMPKIHDQVGQKILTPEQIRGIIRGDPVPRNRVLLRVLYLTGIRASEAAGLRWCDLDIRGEEGQITVLGKGDKIRAIRLATNAWRELQSIRPAEAQPQERVFTADSGRPMHRTTITNLVAAAARRVGIPVKVSAHWMRHGHASHAIEKGAPLTLIAATLGHVSVTTTQRYIHARPEDSSGRYLSG